MKKNEKMFAFCSFIKGIGSLYPFRNHPFIDIKKRIILDDREALKSDWNQIGKDIRERINKYGKHNK